MYRNKQLGRSTIMRGRKGHESEDESLICSTNLLPPLMPTDIGSNHPAHEMTQDSLECFIDVPDIYINDAFQRFILGYRNEKFMQ